MPDPRPPSLLFFAGSSREASFNKQLAKLGHRLAISHGVDATYADLGRFPMPVYNGDDELATGVPAAAHEFLAVLQAHSGVFIASPEYNASLSPLLKNTLDWISRIRGPGTPGLEVFKTRVFALGAAAAGGLGGLRGLAATRTVLEMGLGALVLPDQFLLPRAATAFDQTGNLIDAGAQDRFVTLVGKLARTSRALHG